MTPDRKIEMLHADLIEVHNRLRDVDTNAVGRIADSMEKIGLRTPISVRYYQERPEGLPGDTDDALVLMTGAHRLAAAKKLGWEKVECFVYYEGDQIDAQLWEIAENLHRADLSKEERDRQIKRYAELLKEREQSGYDKMSDPGIDSRGQRKSPQQQAGVAKRLAQETGLNVRTVQRVLSDKPKQTALQRRFISADPLDDSDSKERQVAALMSAWNKAGKEAREEFLTRIDTPVFDRGAA